VDVRFDIAFVGDGALPQFEIDLTSGFDGLLGDGLAGGVVEGASEEDFTDRLFGSQMLDGFFHPRPPLVTHLDEALVFAGRLDDELGLERVLAARFFDENMLARLHGKDRCGRVPEVRRRDEHRIERFIVEEAAKIFHSFAG
jgi:hypothetical protein